MTNHTSNNQTKTLIFYDGNCGFCRWSVSLALRFDARARLQPIPLQTPGVLEAQGIARADAEKALHVLTSEGRVVCAGWALWAIVRELPWWRSLRLLWRVPGFATGGLGLLPCGQQPRPLGALFGICGCERGTVSSRASGRALGEVSRKAMSSVGVVCRENAV